MRLLAEGIDPRRIAAQLSLAIGVVVSVLWVVYRFAPFLYDSVALRAVVRDAGPLAPVVFVVLQAVQVILAPIPGQLTAFAGGFLFGWYGLLYSLVGVTIGSVIAFWLSRRLGRPYVESVLAPGTLERFDSVLGETGDVAVAVFFLLPGLPDDVICFLAGLTPIRFRRFVALSIVARLPAYVVATMLGSSVAQGEFRTAFVLLILFGATTVLAYRYRDAIVRRLSDDGRDARGTTGETGEVDEAGSVSGETR